MEHKDFLRLIRERNPVVWRDDYLADSCLGLDVLDIGCVDHRAEIAEQLGDGWLHKRLTKVANSVIGIDHLQSEVEILVTRDFNIICADAEQFDLGQTFDVIIAGDIIEHLSNVGSFLISVRKHMRLDSKLIITTPNPIDIEQTLRVFAGGEIVLNSDHTMWLDPRVLFQIAARNGLTPIEFRWTRTRFRALSGKGLKWSFLRKLAKFVSWYRPLLRSEFAVAFVRVD